MALLIYFKGGVNMAQSLLNFVLDLFFWLVGLIGSIVIYPIQLILVSIFPEIGNFLTDVLSFFSDYVANMISFIKELFLEISCLPRELYLVLIIFIFARFAIAPAIRSIKLIVNIWKFKSGGDTN